MIGRRNSFFPCPLCFFPYSRLSSYHLRLSLCLVSFLLFPCASVWENTRAWVPHVLKPYWMAPSFFSPGEIVCLGGSFVYQTQINLNSWLFDVYINGVLRELNDWVLGRDLEIIGECDGLRYEINQLLFVDDTQHYWLTQSRDGE